MRVDRELSPLRLSLSIQTPSGATARWGQDEGRAQNSFADLRFSTTIPGGFETLDCRLARSPAYPFPDLERLANIRVVGVGGELAGEYRLERAPEASGDQASISPSAVGWQAHLDDNKTVRALYIDRDLSRWTAPNVQVVSNYLAAGYNPSGGTAGVVAADPVITLPNGTTTGSGTAAGLVLEIQELVANQKNSAISTYNTHGLIIGRLRCTYGTYDSNNSSPPPPNNMTAAVWVKEIGVAGNLSSSGAVDVTPNVDHIEAHLYNSTTPQPAVANQHWKVIFSNLRVFGDHGLSTVGATADTEGLLASDIVRHAVTHFAPLLAVTKDSIQPSSYPVTQAAFLEATTASEIIKQAVRFGLPDWAVWDDRTFWLYERGMKGRRWRARVGPSRLTEAGPQVDRMFNGVVVQFQDVDGSTMTVGPVGSKATYEDPALSDSDSSSPANRGGAKLWQLLSVGTCTKSGAIAIGRVFLAQAKQLDRSGRAVLTGHVADDRGCVHPCWMVRAGDYISFTDASDTAYRRIVRTEYSHSDRGVSLDLDTPPDALSALLERLGAAAMGAGTA